MRIDGKAISAHILEELTPQVTSLKQNGVTPTLAIILIGDNPASVSYIKQKQKAAEAIGAKLILDQQSTSISPKSLKELMQKYNNDSSVHGIIIQRPLPPTMNALSMNQFVDRKKDVDGFGESSPFDAPVAMAVMTILKEIGAHVEGKRIVVIGRGETAGTPITRALIKRGFHPTIVHSQTPNPRKITKQADILISCVGKKRVVTKEAIKPGAIVIGVGMHREDNGTFHGDYEEEDIADIARAFTPTPGGVGPVNVTCLMKNLIKACMMQTGGKV